MPVKDFELKSIDAERFSEKGAERKNVRVDHNSSVTSMKQRKKRITEIAFRFTASYSGMGRIEIEGKLLYKGEKANLAKKWKDTNQMPDEAANEVHSTVLSNCIPEAVLLARELQLPPPIPLPQVDVSQGDDKGPKGGMEVA